MKNKASLINLVFLILSALVGAFVFLLYFEIEILNPKNISWITSGDRLQHYLGSYAFRLDDWHFPLTKTTLIAYPEGVSIIYTDSNPLVSILFKLLKPIFPPEYQFFGLWFLLCWMLQGLLAFLVVKRLTKNNLYALATSILFCLIPAMFHRIMHTNLVAFWAILWAINVYLMDEEKSKKKEILFFIVCLISGLIHGYFLVMNMLILGTWYGRKMFVYAKNKEYKPLGGIVFRVIIYFIILFVVLWCFGFFYNTPEHNSDMGFGEFSMNLLSPFDSLNPNFSTLLTSLPHLKKQGLEGFQYLGAGTIILYTVVASLGLISKRKEILNSKPLLVVIGLMFIGFVIMTGFFPVYHTFILFSSVLFFFVLVYIVFKGQKHDFYWLFIPALLCLIFALSHKIYLGETRVLRYSIFESGVGAKFFQMIRSSGRFFWVTNLIFLLGILSFLYSYIKNSKILYGLLFLCVVVQLIDFGNVKNYTYQNFTAKKNITSPFLEMISSAKRVDFIEGKSLNISLAAIQNGIPINSFYMVHGNGRETVKKIDSAIVQYQLGEKALNDSTIYFITKNNTWSFPNYQGINFYSFTNDLYAVITDGFKFQLDRPKVNMEGNSLTEVLAMVPQKNLVVITVKDEASRKMPMFFSKKLDADYGTTLSDLQFRESYIAVFERGVLKHEQKGFGQLDYTHMIKKEEVRITSVGENNNASAKSSVMIKGLEYSMDQRGLNVVMLDSIEMYSSFNFDTYFIQYDK